MATIHLQPPEKFDFSKPDSWSHWKCRFEQFRARQVWMANPKANRLILYSTAWEKGQKRSYCPRASQRSRGSNITLSWRTLITILRSVGTLFLNAPNSTSALNYRETAEQFIMDLQSLVEHCEYGDL